MELKVPWDAAIETTVSKFEESVLSAQVRVDSLHPFDREYFAAALREQIIDFYKDVQKGYDLIVQTVLDLTEKGVQLTGVPIVGKRSMRAVKHLFPDPEAIERFSDDSFVESWVKERKPLFMAIGLSLQAMTTMYEAARSILDENKDEDARIAFRFLLVLAPHLCDFWMGYGVALLRLNQAKEAVDAFEQAVTFDQQSIPALLLLCRSLVEANRRGEGEARLNARIDDAARRGEQDEYELLEAARYELGRFGK
jgi:tetratricopeptide (TPR) repeat protein